MKRLLNYKRAFACVFIGLAMAISMGSVYANTDVKTLFTQWADRNINLVKSKLNVEQEKALNKEQAAIIKQVTGLNVNTLKEIENSQSEIQKEVISDIQKELSSLESRLDNSYKVKKQKVTGDFDLAVEEVTGNIHNELNTIYEDPQLVPSDNTHKVDFPSYEDAHLLVNEEIEKTKKTINQLKSMADQSQDSHVKKYLFDKALVLEIIIQNIEKNEH